MYVLDEPDTIISKFKAAVIEDVPQIRRSDAAPGISNLIEILSVASGRAVEDVEAQFDGRRGDDLAVAAGEAVSEWLRPVRDRYRDIRADEHALEATLARGARKAQRLADETLADVRRVMGLR